MISKVLDVYERQRMLLTTFQTAKAHLKRQKTMYLLQMDLCENETNSLICKSCNLLLKTVYPTYISLFRYLITCLLYRNNCKII